MGTIDEAPTPDERGSDRPVGGPRYGGGTPLPPPPPVLPHPAAGLGAPPRPGRRWLQTGLLGVCLLALVGVLVVTLVGVTRSTVEADDDTWGVSGMFGESRERIMTGVCERGEAVEEALPHVPGARLQGGVLRDEDGTVGAGFPLRADEGDRETWVDDVQVTVVACAEITSVTATEQCELIPGQVEEMVTGVELEIRLIALRDGEELRRSTGEAAVSECPHAFVGGVDRQVDDLYTLDLRARIADVAQAEALDEHGL